MGMIKRNERNLYYRGISRPLPLLRQGGLDINKDKINKINMRDIQKFEIDMPDNWRINKQGSQNEKGGSGSSRLHDGCLRCHGSGKWKDGSICFHNLSCNCQKCSAR